MWVAMWEGFGVVHWCNVMGCFGLWMKNFGKAVIRVQEHRDCHSAIVVIVPWTASTTLPCTPYRLDRDALP